LFGCEFSNRNEIRVASVFEQERKERTHDLVELEEGEEPENELREVAVERCEDLLGRNNTVLGFPFSLSSYTNYTQVCFHRSVLVVIYL